MNRLKDLLYDSNDILVALLVLCCAAMIITTRVNALMTYPEKTILEQKSRSTNSQANEPGDNVVIVSGDEDVASADWPDDIDAATLSDGAGTGADADAGTGTDADADADTGAATQPDNVQHSAFSLYIAYGESMNQVGKDLVALGFFDDTQDFFNCLDSHNAALRVQTGNFVIPAGSTKDDIIRIITGRN
ncbi:MAG: hypothetical protein FWG53_10205 [Clostridiales bacterium]|nr:hypothetical protein [Clostridiales bacterium]